MPALHAQLGDEVACDLRHHLVRIPRILVLRARHHHRRPRTDGGQQIVVAELAYKPGHGFEQQDPGAFAQARLEAADGAADAGEPAPRIDGGVVERRGAAVRVAGHAHAVWIDFGGLQQRAQRPLGVVQALAHQQVAFQQPMAHGVVVLQPVVEVRLGALHRAASVLEGDGIRCQHRETPARERRAEGLERIAYQARHFALAEVELAVVLVEDHHAAKRLAPVRREQECRDAVVFEAAVFDAFAIESLEGFDLAALDLHPHRRPEPEAVPKERGDVIHGPR